MIGKRELVLRTLIHLFYWLFVISFIFTLIAGYNYQSVHILSGYISISLVVCIISLSVFRKICVKADDTSYYYTAHFFNRKIYLKPSNSLQFIPELLVTFLLMLILFTIVLAILTGMLILAYGERLGPLYSVIDYFPYWVFVTVNDLHAYIAYTSTLLIIILFGCLIEIDSSFRSIPIAKKDQ